MLRKSDIEQAARYMVAQRGECAEHRANKRAQDLARDGNSEAALIWQLIAGEVSVIRSTHNLNFARPVRDRLTVIKGGRA